ncbi:hypothetical protein VKS41_005725 [Umbelopsis sp. WA50703]
MSAYGYPVVAGGYPPRPSPYIMSSSPYYPPGPMAYAQPGVYQPGPMPQPVVYPQPYGRPYYRDDSCCWALYVTCLCAYFYHF